jgi:ankyrin repeat protein
MIASQFGHLQIVQELLNRGANIDASQFGTALERSSTKRRVAIVNELITRGANVDINYARMLQYANQPMREILQKYYQNQ